MATHRPSLNASSTRTWLRRAASRFNGHSSAIPQCICWFSSLKNTTLATFQWPLIGHPSMHQFIAVFTDGVTQVSMATHRPSLNASHRVGILLQHDPRFQWPLIGHPSMHLKHYCAEVARHEFQWPLIGHPSMHRHHLAGDRRTPDRVSMATHRPSLNASVRKVSRAVRSRVVSMATHRPSLNASWRFQYLRQSSNDGFNGHSSAIPQCILNPCVCAMILMWGFGFQWPLIGHPSMHPKKLENVAKKMF